MEHGQPLLTDFDFVDFGCSTGSSLAFGVDHVGGRRGLGFDIDPRKVEKTRAAGYSAEVADVTKLDPAVVGTADFALMLHFLEHLPTAALAEACIDAAVRVADEFVLIRQPYFDADETLERLGLKLYWSDWHGHPNHMSAAALRAPLERLLGEGRIGGYVVFARGAIADSTHTAVHPVGSPRDQHAWTEAEHGPKPVVAFDPPIYREIGAVIRTRAAVVRPSVYVHLANAVALHEGGSGASLPPR